MTPDKTPSDAEIATLYADETGFALGDSPAALLDFARAVLAKWGSPVAAVEPVAWLVRADGEDHHAVVSSKRESADLWIKGQQTMGATYVFTVHPLVTPSQPTPAQAGAVLDLNAAAKMLAERMDYPWEHMPEQGRVEMRKHAQAVVEAAHGFTKEGGQP